MKIDHIGIAVSSIEAALPFYQEGLGLDCSPVEQVEGMGVRVVKLDVGDAALELIESTDPEGTIARFISKRGEGIHHICLETDDLDGAIARLSAQGYSPVYDAPRTGAGGHRVNFLKPADARGVLIELLELGGDGA